MKGGVEYKLYFDGKAVDQAFYDMVETVTVEQGIDLATEARIELEMCADDKGNWTGPTEAYARTWKRLRIEVRNIEQQWIPLIDGPVLTWDADHSGEPGQSIMTVVAHDDTELLNIDSTPEVFEGKKDEDVARDLFTGVGIQKVDIETIPDAPQDRPLKHQKHLTELEMLRAIADPWDLHVFVRPPDKAGGDPVGCVKRIDTTKKPKLPMLILTGADRNVETFRARNDVPRATRFRGAQLDIDKVEVTKIEPSAWSQVDLLGQVAAVDDTSKLAIEILSPFISAFRNVDELEKRQQQRVSYTVSATGSVRYGCYSGVLTPFDLISVGAVNAKLCTKYVIKDVTHTLTRSEYRQDFTLMTNAFSKPGPAVGAVPLEVI